MTCSGAVHAAGSDDVAAASGDPATLRRVLAAVQPTVVRYCRGRLGRGDAADEAAREVARRLAVSLADVGSATLPALVYRTAAQVVGERPPSGPAARLPAELREVLVLRVAAGLSVGEVAEMTGLSPGTVRVAQHRAVTALRACSS